jgi:hypothetical protein
MLLLRILIILRRILIILIILRRWRSIILHLALGRMILIFHSGIRLFSCRWSILVAIVWMRLWIIIWISFLWIYSWMIIFAAIVELTFMRLHESLELF